MSRKTKTVLLEELAQLQEENKTLQAKLAQATIEVDELKNLNNELMNFTRKRLSQVDFELDHIDDLCNCFTNKLAKIVSLTNAMLNGDSTLDTPVETISINSTQSLTPQPKLEKKEEKKSKKQSEKVKKM